MFKVYIVFKVLQRRQVRDYLTDMMLKSVDWRDRLPIARFESVEYRLSLFIQAKGSGIYVQYRTYLSVEISTAVHFWPIMHKLLAN